MPLPTMAHSSGVLSQVVSRASMSAPRSTSSRTCRALPARGREMQRGGAVVLLRAGVRRETEVQHEPDRLGVPMIGGVGQDPVLPGGE